jgi:hypothetical protein
MLVQFLSIEQISRKYVQWFSSCYVQTDVVSLQ